MRRVWKQEELLEFLQNNPLGVEVHIGDLDDLNGKDYIFFDYISENEIPSDDGAMYQTMVQLTICVRDYEHRKILSRFLREHFMGSVSYEHSSEFNYYLARMRTGLFIYE